MKYLFLIVASCFVFACGQAETKPLKTEFGLGDNVAIQTISGKPITVANSRESLDRLVKAVVSKDEERYNALIVSGDAFTVENNTKVKITDYKDVSFEVKILEGKFEGKYAWVGQDWVKPLPSK